MVPGAAGRGRITETCGATAAPHGCGGSWPGPRTWPHSAHGARTRPSQAPARAPAPRTPGASPAPVHPRGTPHPLPRLCPPASGSAAGRPAGRAGRARLPAPTALLGSGLPPTCSWPLAGTVRRVRARASGRGGPGTARGAASSGRSCLTYGSGCNASKARSIPRVFQVFPVSLCLCANEARSGRGRVTLTPRGSLLQIPAPPKDRGVTPVCRAPSGSIPGPALPVTRRSADVPTFYQPWSPPREAGSLPQPATPRSPLT